MGIIAIAAMIMTLQASPAPVVATAPPPCADEGYNQFDFWVGEWDVYPNVVTTLTKTTELPLIAHSRTEKLYSGCAVRENWMPVNGGGGGSLNSYDPDTKRWHQTWVGSHAGRVEFEGGRVGDGMALTGFWANVNGPGQDALIRMNYIRQPDGSVRQHGEQSTDHGMTWATNFDFIYVKRTKPLPAK